MITCCRDSTDGKNLLVCSPFVVAFQPISHLLIPPPIKNCFRVVLGKRQYEVTLTISNDASFDNISPHISRMCLHPLHTQGHQSHA
ncbi:hypothetical protein GE061_017979 [Apolygus lucorum]|uniref:Uncharacterized protein n=1 Tax=Apolygus lucorum TaxID=248454 RepID=A0A8S9XCN9_APOLU|nr:hypothetical protein GE061_017979 [Apolygus lucorum]